MNIRKYIINPKNLALFLLIGGIALSPSFSLGMIISETSGVLRPLETRIEDFVLAIILLSMFVYLLIKRGLSHIPKPPLLLPISAWLFFGFISLLVNVIFGNVPLLRSSLFFAKEVEFFAFYFATFYLIDSTKTAILALNIWVFFTALNVLWVIIHFFTPTSGYYYYGPTLFAEPSNPFASGTVFLTIALFFLNLLLYYYLPKSMPIFKKIFVTMIFISPIVGIFGSGSQTAGVAFAFSSLVLGGLLFIKTHQRKYILYISSIVLVISTIITILLLTNSSSLLRQVYVLPKAEEEFSLSVKGSRANIWVEHLLPTFNSPIASAIGFGKSIFGESHNQFIRNFAETGIIGLLLFIILVYELIRTSAIYFMKSSDPLSTALSAGLFCTTLAMILVSIPAESFIYSVKLSETFWSLTGITMAVLYRNKLKFQA